MAAAARQWNAEANGLLNHPDWKFMPRLKLSKDRDENMKAAGLRILDTYSEMSEEERRSAGYAGMQQDMHEAPFDDQARTRRPMQATRCLAWPAWRAQKMHALLAPLCNS